MVYQVGRQDNGVTDARGRSMDLLVGLSHVMHQDEETMMMMMLMMLMLMTMMMTMTMTMRILTHLSLPLVKQVNNCSMQPGPFHGLSVED